MAISVDNANDGTFSAGASSLSYSQTLGAGATLLVAEVLHGPSISVSAITYGGVAPTGVINNTSHQGYNYHLYWWFNPPTGANTLSVTFSGTSLVVLRSASYNGVANTAPDTGVTAQSGTVTTFNTDPLTPSNANSWIIGIMEQSTVGGAAGAGTVFRAGVGNGDGIFDSNGTVSGASSLQATCSPGQIWTGLLAAFAPAGAGGALAPKPLVVKQAPNRASTY